MLVLKLLASATVYVAVFFFADISVAQTDLWREVAQKEVAPEVLTLQQRQLDTKSRYLWIDRKGLSKRVSTSQTSGDGTFLLKLPEPNGGFRDFEFQLAGTMSPGLARKFPNIQAFSGRSVGKGVATAQMELTPSGLSVQVLDANGRWMIEPLSQSDGARVVSYFSRDAKRRRNAFQCGVTAHDKHVLGGGGKHSRSAQLSRTAPSAKQFRSRGSELRTYRLAVATTGEYGEYHGGTVEGGLSAVVKVINRVNGIFNSEISVGFELVDNNDDIIFTDPDDDPFDGNDDTAVLIEESQTVIDDVIESENYDIGHTFGTAGGGLAGAGPCNDEYKANGVTGGYEGDAFAVDYVAHEIGHQFSMDHTFNSSASNCIDQRSASAAFEAGSGTTIMSYSGICPPDNIPQPHLVNNLADPMFHSYSFEEAANYVEGYGSTCGVVSATGNTNPTVDAGPSYTIPASTPFFIEGEGSDGDGDTVTYSWEQRDLGPAAALDTPDDGAIPLFRARAPVTTAKRYLPQLATVVAGEMDNAEKLPRKARSMVFALTTRDERGGRNSDTTDITVIAEPLADKPFSVAEPDLGGALGRIGTVRWNVGGTDVAPIAVQKVDLYLSTDGGKSFDSTAFATTTNDGYARVEFPAGVKTDSARIMLRGRDNIFFDVSDANFSVDADAAPTPEVPAPSNVSGTAAGDTAIDIAFTPGASSGVDYYDATCVGTPRSAAFSGSAISGADFNLEQSASSSIELSGDGSVAPEGLSVSVDITHTFRGDVIIELTSPSGITVELKGLDGNDTADNVSETYVVTGVSGEPVSGNWQLKVSDGYEGDDGVFNSWSLSGTSLTPPRTVTGLAAPETPFSDSKSISSEIELSAEGEVSPDEFEVEVNITHSYRSDVVLELESPSGKRITLRQPSKEDGSDNLIGVYPQNLKSVTPFSELAGEALSGSWFLHVSDQAPSDDGVLNSWRLSQKQYIYSGGSANSPVRVNGLPSGNTYTCSIAGIYSDVSPSRQSESKSAGVLVLGSLPPPSGNAPNMFYNLLQTLLGIRSAPQVADTAKLGNDGSEVASRGASTSGNNLSSPSEIPVLGGLGLAFLTLCVGLMGWRARRVAR
jgi:subtilisin-like proprotein convertase family protein